MILLVDAHNLVWRCHHTARDLTDAKGNLSGVFFGVLSSLHKLTVDYENAVGIVVVWDGRRSERRMKLYPNYKGQRVDDSQRTPEANEELRQVYKQIEDLREGALPALGIPQVYVPTAEADDVIWTATKVFDGPLLIISNDNDFFQLVDRKVKVFNPNLKIHKALKQKGTIVSLDNFQVATGYIHPDSFLDGKIIMGDKSDNIKGIKGVADGTVQALFRQFPTLADVFDNRAEVARTSKRWADIVAKENSKILARNYQLMALTEGAIAGQEYCPKEVIRGVEAATKCSPSDMEKMIRIKGSFRLLAKFQSWFHNFSHMSEKWAGRGLSRVRNLKDVIDLCSSHS